MSEKKRLPPVAIAVTDEGEPELVAPDAPAQQAKRARLAQEGGRGDEEEHGGERLAGHAEHGEGANRVVRHVAARRS